MWCVSDDSVRKSRLLLVVWIFLVLFCKLLVPICLLKGQENKFTGANNELYKHVATSCIIKCQTKLSNAFSQKVFFQ